MAHLSLVLVYPGLYVGKAAECGGLSMKEGRWRGPGDGSVRPSGEAVGGKSG